jgi:hypothetical protein
MNSCPCAVPTSIISDSAVISLAYKSNLGVQNLELTRKSGKPYPTGCEMTFSFPYKQYDCNMTLNVHMLAVCRKGKDDRAD